MNSAALVASGSFEEKRFTIFVHGENPVSQVASEIYRLPLVSLVNLPKKLEESMLLQHGVKNCMQLDTTKEKLKETNIEKYGVANCFQNKTIKEKAEKTEQKY